MSTARILRRFAPAVSASARSELGAVASRDLARAEEAARRLGVPRAHGSYEALLDDPEIDAVYIALPNHLHAPYAVRCAAAGKHVLCEKPLGLSPAEVDAMAAAASEHGVHIVEAFVHLHHPQARAIKDTLDSGGLGRLLLLRGSFGFRVAGPDNIRMNPGYGGGALWDVGCYPASLFVALAGAAPDEVFGYRDLAASGVDRSFAGQLSFRRPGGERLLAQLDCSLCAPFRESLEIVGERGRLVPRSAFRADIDGSPSGFTVSVDGEAPREVAVAGQDPFRCEVEAMEAAILDGRPPALSLRFSRQVAATLAALHESARTGAPVSIPAAA